MEKIRCMQDRFRGNCEGLTEISRLTAARIAELKDLIQTQEREAQEKHQEIN